MAFFRRFLSGDFRRGLAAEAAGDYSEAARHYALAGERDKVAEMHLLRSERAKDPAEKIDELRDALRYAGDGTAVRVRVLVSLGRQLLLRARIEGAATARDQESVREAADLLVEAGEHREAAAALQLIGDEEGAARAFERGGHVEELEEVLAQERERRQREGAARDAFARYQQLVVDGDRDGALAALRECVETAADKGDYRRLLDELAARLLTAGKATLVRRDDARRVAVAGGGELRLGRDPSCHFTLRGAGLSRAHALVRAAGGEFHLRDAGSRLGTWLAGMRIDGEVPLAGSGMMALGEDQELAFRVAGGVLRLEVTRGLDRGAVLLAAAEEQPLDLGPELAPLAVTFRGGRPFASGPELSLGTTRARGPAQLARGDLLRAGAVAIEVE